MIFPVPAVANASAKPSARGGAVGPTGGEETQGGEADGTPSVDPYLRFNQADAVEVSKQTVAFAELCYWLASAGLPGALVLLLFPVLTHPLITHPLITHPLITHPLITHLPLPTPPLGASILSLIKRRASSRYRPYRPVSIVASRRCRKFPWGRYSPRGGIGVKGRITTTLIS